MGLLETPIITGIMAIGTNILHGLPMDTTYKHLQREDLKHIGHEFPLVGIMIQYPYMKSIDGSSGTCIRASPAGTTIIKLEELKDKGAKIYYGIKLLC